MKAWIARRNWWAIGFWTLVAYLTIARYEDGWFAMMLNALTIWSLYSIGQLSSEREAEIKQLPEDEKSEFDFWNWN